MRRGDGNSVCTRSVDAGKQGLVCTVHTGSSLDKTNSDLNTTKQSNTAEPNQVPDNLISNASLGKQPTKAQKISRAMQAYMERAKAHEDKMKEEIADYELASVILLTLWGKIQTCLNKRTSMQRAIEYLLPSGLTHIGARPILKHPYEVFPKRKAAEFGQDGRPFHSLFFTGKPNFYSLLHDAAWKIEDLKKEQMNLEKKGRLHEEADKKINLNGSDWISAISLKDMMLEPVGEHEHKHFVLLMERLADLPLSYKEEEFIMKYRRNLMTQSLSGDIPKPLVDDKGRQYIKAEEQVMTPLQFVGLMGEVDVEATVTLGGETGQSGAIRLALSRALVSFVDADTRER
ncbi:hypothetical protein C0Q70_10991 [Pomacea canaliculata]|uniref:28S ribosomal protein S9, mitochondrial n=1 Tax=Pomacea canaliculata TaxID=400727 RepID=A0A2T7P4Q5_POMCA|nr:hypothetical protein C0Q70_10991 [Pomacea canaliculata]